MITLADPLADAVVHYPDRVAVIDGDTRLTYAALADRSARLAAGLASLGLDRGDRVAVLAANGHRFLEAFLGLPAAGLVVVPLNTRLAEAELRTIVVDCGARVLLTDRDPGRLAACVDHVVDLPDGYESLLAGATPPASTPTPLRSRADRRGDQSSTAAGCGAAAPLSHEAGDLSEHLLGGGPIDEGSVAALFYTGGTTGMPKGVMLTHRNLVRNAVHKTVACSLTGDDVFLAAPAMFHVAGVAPVVGLVWLGARIVTVPAFDPGLCLDLIERHRATLLMPVPTMVASLVAEQRRAPRDVSSLRMLGHAGSPIATELIETAHAVFPDAELAQFYGATETASVVTCLRHEERAIGGSLIGSCGLATPGVAVRVVRSDGSPCDEGEVGEVQVLGANVTPGYWGNVEATAAAFADDGWYRTGDLGCFRHGGHLFVVDRLKDMIVSGGENVYSVEVEDVLHRHPAVVEAAVFGVPDPHWGEAVHAVVVVDEDTAAGDPDALVEELRAHCRVFVAGFKVPKAIDIRTEPLPKSGPGKILKRVLRAPHWVDDAAAPPVGAGGLHIGIYIN